jgi:siroheme synthase (precorrin-2 oxidase/ferrochelatase)
MQLIQQGRKLRILINKMANTEVQTPFQIGYTMESSKVRISQMIIVGLKSLSEEIYTTG